MIPARIRAQAEQELRSRRKIIAPAHHIDLSEYTERTTGFALEPWQRIVCARLQKLTGENKQTGQRILIHGPPQYGKSIIISQRFPSYALGCDPATRVRVACYNVTHAVRFSKVNLALMQSPEYVEMFPNPDARVPDRTAGDEWSTIGRTKKLDGNPSMMALGLGTGFTGLGVDNLVIDDPYKNAQSARSEAINVFLWDWYTDVVKPRLNPLTNVIVMFHRWWEGDFAGRLMDEGGWEMMRFPAIADGESDDPTQRQEGELLSNRYPKSYLDNILEKNAYSFWSLYQGKPRAKEGNFFQRQWFKMVPSTPLYSERVRYWDIAGADVGKGDWTCGILMARDQSGHYYIEDVQRFQKTAHERNRKIREIAENDSAKYDDLNANVDTRVRIYIEQGIGLGKEPTDNIIKGLAGFLVYSDPAHGHKEERAEPLQAMAQAHNVSVVTADWNNTLFNEMESFPHGKNDDQVDAASGGFLKLANVVRAVEDDDPFAGWRG